MPYMKNLQGVLNNWIRNDLFYSVNDVQNGLLQSRRVRVSAANFLAGYVLLPAVPSFGYRLVGADMIAVGGGVGGSTTLDIVGVQSGVNQKLTAMAIAGLTQSTRVSVGSASTTILADGASFARNDINTPITLGVTGAAITGATSVDVFLSYIVEHE
jgi:hypothetical protein